MPPTGPGLAAATLTTMTIKLIALILLDADDGYVIQRIGFAYHLCVVPLCRGQQYRRKFGQFRAIRQKPDTRDAIASRAPAGTMPTKLGSGRHANR